MTSHPEGSLNAQSRFMLQNSIPRAGTDETIRLSKSMEKDPPPPFPTSLPFKLQEGLCRFLVKRLPSFAPDQTLSKAKKFTYISGRQKRKGFGPTQYTEVYFNAIPPIQCAVTNIYRCPCFILGKKRLHPSCNTLYFVTKLN